MIYILQLSGTQRVRIKYATTTKELAKKIDMKQWKIIAKKQVTNLDISMVSMDV
jgi:hypothetical protein